MLDFGKNLRIFWNSQKIFAGQNRKFFQYICPMYFLKNRNYDLFNLKFLPRSFVEMIRIEAIITPAD